MQRDRSGLVKADHTALSLLTWRYLKGGGPRCTDTRPGGPGRRPLLLAAVLTVGLAFATGACGGGSPGASVARVATTTSVVSTTPATQGGQSSGSQSPGGALVQYARCMRSHGVVSFPEPASLGAPGAIRAFKGQIAASVASLASSPEFQHAQRACAKYYGPPTTSAAQVTPQEMRKLLAVSRCMRAHGVPTFLTPTQPLAK